MDWINLNQFVQSGATVVGIAGGLAGLFRFFSDRREKDIREWQKVVISKIFQQSESKALSFASVLEKYRSEAQAFAAFNLTKTEISEDALRRVLLELVSSNILSMEIGNLYKLKVSKTTTDPIELLTKINAELARLVAANPFLYTLDEVSKEVAPKVGLEIPILKNTLKQSIAQGLLVQDELGHLAFPK